MKSPRPDACPSDRNLIVQQLQREYEVYQRLPKCHDRLIKLIDFNGEVLTLQRMKYGALDYHLLNQHFSITVSYRIQWAIEAAEAVQLLHSHDIIHCDIKPGNLLLDDELHVRIIDFGGSMIDGKSRMVYEHPGYFMPRAVYTANSKKSDLFALGSTIYYIMMNEDPYQNLKDGLVTWKFKNKTFPKTGHIPLGDIIRNCWLYRYRSADELRLDLKAAAEKYGCAVSQNIYHDQIS